jgi:hypothetical protein
VRGTNPVFRMIIVDLSAEKNQWHRREDEIMSFRVKFNA